MRHDTIPGGPCLSSRVTRPRLTILRTVGDVDPVDYGGGYVYRYGKEPGLMLEYFEPESDGDGAMILRYGCCIENPDWADWAAVSSYTGRDVSAYTGLDWADPLSCVFALEDAISFYGWDNFDSYPDRMTRHEAERIARRRAKSLRRRGPGKA